jgi:putative ABC transport system ATP-binding protein
MTAFIECRRLTRVFEAGRSSFRALDGVDLRITRGELLAVMGSSGSGKSTLLNAIGGLDKPTSGEVWLAGANLAELPQGELADLRNRSIGFVFQQFNLLARYSAQRNVELPMLYAGHARSVRAQRSRLLLNGLGLGAHLNKRPTQMSGGQQQRVAIARALANSPPLILADEPTGALDSATSAEVLKLLVSLQREQGLTVIIVTHDPQVGSQCDRVVRFADGRIIEERLRGDGPSLQSFKPATAPELGQGAAQ